MSKELITETPSSNGAQPKDDKAIIGHHIGTSLIYGLVTQAKIGFEDKVKLDLMTQSIWKKTGITGDQQYWMSAGLLAAYELGRHNIDEDDKEIDNISTKHGTSPETDGG